MLNDSHILDFQGYVEIALKIYSLVLQIYVFSLNLRGVFPNFVAIFSTANSVAWPEIKIIQSLCRFCLNFSIDSLKFGINKITTYLFSPYHDKTQI